MALARCDGTYGCTACDSPTTYPSPPPPGGELLGEAVAGQLQESAIVFFAEHLSDVLAAVFEVRNGRAVIYLPEASFAGDTFATRDGCIGVTPWNSCPAQLRTFRSRLELPLAGIDDVVEARLLFSGGPERMRITLRDLDLYLDVALRLDLGAGGDAACRVRDESPGVPAVHIDTVSFSLVPSIDAAGLFWLDVTDVDVAIATFDDADLAQLTISACNTTGCDDPTCHDGILDLECGSYCGLGNLIFSTAEFFQDFLAPLIESFAPALIERLLDATLDAANGKPLAGVARWPSVGAALGGRTAAQVFPAGESFGAGARAAPDTFRVSGPAGARGLALTLEAGSFGETSPCPPTVALPAFNAQPGALPIFDGAVQVVDPLVGRPRTERYHLVLVASELLARQIGHSFYRAGGLCLTLGATEIERLTGGSFVPTLAGLAIIAPELSVHGDPEAPVSFVLHPTGVPSIRYGDGNATSLIIADLGEVGASAYALLADHPERLATVAADVQVHLGVERTARNSLAITLDRIDVKNVVEVYDEASGPVDFAAIFEVTIELAVARLLESFGELELDLAPLVSSMLGGAPIYGRINDVQRLGEPSAPYLAAFFTFCDQDDLANPELPPCFTPPRPPVPPPPLAQAFTVRSVARGQVEIAVPTGFSYQTRVDGGAWSSARPAAAGVLIVRSGLLRLPGAHSILVSRRPAGRYWQADEVVAVEVTIP